MPKRTDNDKQTSPWKSDDDQSLPRRRSTDAPVRRKKAPEQPSDPSKIERQINLRTDIETAERFRYLSWFERMSYSDTLKLLLDTYDANLD